MPAVDIAFLPFRTCSAVSLARQSAALHFTSHHCSTVAIELPAVVGRGDLLPWPKQFPRLFFMADRGFLVASCSRSLCCLSLGVTAVLIGVAVMLSLLRAPFPSSIIAVKFAYNNCNSLSLLLPVIGCNLNLLPLRLPVVKENAVSVYLREL